MTAMFIRIRKSGRRVHYISFTDQAGNEVQELVGPNKAEAEARLVQRRREVAAGTYNRELKAATFGAYAELWISKRTARHVADDASDLRKHAVPIRVLGKPLGEWRVWELKPRHFIALADHHLARHRAGVVGAIAPKTLKNVIGLCRTLMRDAVIDELTVANPVVLPRGYIPLRAAPPKDVYSGAELRALLDDGPLLLRTVFALLTWTGMRHGEAAGLRWKDWVVDTGPLTGLIVDSQYDDRPLKTTQEITRARVVPVRQELAAALELWGREGWAMEYGRLPVSGDFIAPSLQDPAKPRTDGQTRKALQRACKRLGMRCLDVHRFRHTFISRARQNGADKTTLERVTHNASGDVIDLYTHGLWLPLCEAVECFSLDARAIRAPVISLSFLQKPAK